MPTPGIVNWNGSQLTTHIVEASIRALTSVEQVGHEYWDVAAPISTDPRSTGDLRRSWFSPPRINFSNNQVTLTIGASAKHAIYVEYGTYKMPAQSPLRATAGEIVAMLPYTLTEQLSY